MATRSYVPRSDEGLKNFADNLNTRMNAETTAIGITLAQAAAFTVLYDDYVAKLNPILVNPDERTKPQVAAKNTAREALLDDPNGIRALVRLIQAHPGLTNEQREQLQITVPDETPTTVPVPQSAPVLSILSVSGQTITYTLRDPADSNRVAKPEGVASAALYMFVGDDPPPLNVQEWESMGSVTRTNNTITLPSNLVSPGSKVWLMAAWRNPREQQGPMSVAQHVYLAGGYSAAA